MKYLMHLVYWVMKLTNQPFLPEIPYILAKIVLGVCVPNTPSFHISSYSYSTQYFHFL